MAEYIEKVELIKKLCFETAEWYYSPTIKTIKEFPAADVQPVRHGKWALKSQRISDIEIKLPTECSNCDFYSFGAEKYNYCPNCGAKMDETEG